MKLLFFQECPFPLSTKLIGESERERGRERERIRENYAENVRITKPCKSDKCHRVLFWKPRGLLIYRATTEILLNKKC